MSNNKSSSQSIIDATRWRAEKSRHANSMGAAGYISAYDENQAADFLSRPGETAIVNPPADGMKNFEIGVAWDNITPAPPLSPKAGFFQRLFQKKETPPPAAKNKKGVDLDIGCLYELENGKRGAIQAFGNLFGNLEEEPFIHLSGDERTGEAEGEDEIIHVNGAQWNQIKRLILYVYIYDGADSWATIKPQIQVRVPGEKPMVVSLGAKRQEMCLCAVAGLDNVRGGIKMTNYLEYFPGHLSMDRAFGFGLRWEDGRK